MDRRRSILMGTYPWAQSVAEETFRLDLAFKEWE